MIEYHNIEGYPTGSDANHTEAALTFKFNDTHCWNEVPALTTFAQSPKLVSNDRKCARLAATICFIFKFCIFGSLRPQMVLFYSCI
jgi:hypothetical protein